MEQRDDLTQLFSRGVFDAELKAAVSEASRQNHPLALVLADIDHFKKVNDAHGHQVGDAVLRDVAARLESVAFGKGRVYRYGGEEITIILQNHSVAEGLAVAERARRQIEKDPVHGISVSMSFGLAPLPDHASEAEGLVHCADQALYDAKNRGRNLVRLFGEPAPIKPGPREPERKEAQPGRLTDQQKGELRRRLLRREAIACPEDGAFFEIHDMTSLGSVGREFLIVCPDCGLTGELRGG